MSLNISEWSFLWDGSEPGWALVNAGTVEEKEYTLVNMITNHVLLVDIDDEDFEELIEFLKIKNIEIIDDYASRHNKSS
ncbi:hypothetical protein A4J64_002484 [Salmonella enterica subsp. enterica serovar Losangeles]|nr:hypothetical protein [Salmonella enterica subsp. enterica serovar Losangeles]